MVESKETENNKKLTLEVTPEQAEHLETLFEMAKTLASPLRLALLGALAARPKESLTLEELAKISQVSPAQLERDLRQLTDNGFVLVEEWQAAKPGREPLPVLLRLNPDYLKTMPQLITVLHQLNSQLKPAEKTPIQDERAKTLKQFIKDGKLTGWPAQFKRQVFVLEEVAKVFEPEVSYTEREVDTILKNIYEYDHCTLRRYLVDLKFLERAEGVYHKA
jgi:hypothetical protein